jgi:hypothetical protein
MGGSVRGKRVLSSTFAAMLDNNGALLSTFAAMSDDNGSLLSTFAAM